MFCPDLQLVLSRVRTTAEDNVTLVVQINSQGPDRSKECHLINFYNSLRVDKEALCLCAYTRRGFPPRTLAWAIDVQKRKNFAKRADFILSAY